MQAQRISKATGYKTRIYCAEYDLAGMINAYGARHVKELIDLLASGQIKTNVQAQRWAADRALYQSEDHIVIERETKQPVKAPKRTTKKAA